ncbi:MAG: GNAT family N-acetyltransferase [Planctomycetota bacterium]
MAGELTAAYNRAVQAVPHCYAVKAEDFAAAVGDAGPSCNDDKPLNSLRALAAVEGGSVLGFIDGGVRPGDEGHGDGGMVRMLWYEPGRRDVGQLLLEAAEDHLRARGVDAIDAFHQHYTYAFYYLDSAYLSDRLGHVAALLAFNDYRKCMGEVFLDWPDFDPPAPAATDVPAEVSVTRRETPGPMPAVLTKAYLDGKEIGECHIGRVGDYTEDERSRHWCFVNWLGVRGEHQGRGLGKHLLAAALVEARSVGYRHVGISTAWDNHRAFLFYANFGFAVSDWTYGWRREL